MKILRLLRRATFLIWLSAGLVVCSATLATWAFQLSLQVASLTASAATTAVKHRKEITKAVARAKAKARLRRVLTAVPAVGAGAAVAFEAQDYSSCQEQNPEGSVSDYACEVAELSAEVVDDVLQELPEMVRPTPEWVLAQLPECNVNS